MQRLHDITICLDSDQYTGTLVQDLLNERLTELRQHIQERSTLRDKLHAIGY